MLTTTLAKMIGTGEAMVSLRSMALLRPFYKAAFLAAASRSGVLAAVAKQPLSLENLAKELGIKPPFHRAFQAWLEMGVRVGELKLGNEGYSLSGFFAKRLARPEFDPVAALFIEVIDLHQKMIFQTPEKLKRGELWTLADQDGPLIARSTRALEPFVSLAVERAVPKNGPARMLEVGCGSGVYMRQAAGQNPQLTVLGLELQPDVAEKTLENMKRWGLDKRVDLKVSDVREFDSGPDFDLVTLHNNIYYFPQKDRPALLERLVGFLKPGGGFLLTTSCRGGSALLETLNLWGETTEGCGPLPEPGDMAAMMRAAGFEQVRVKKLIPGEAFYSFYGIKKR